MTNQQFADAALSRWQELRDLPPEDRIEILMSDFFRPPAISDVEFEAAMRMVSEVMADA